MELTREERVQWCLLDFFMATSWNYVSLDLDIKILKSLIVTLPLSSSFQNWMLWRK